MNMKVQLFDLDANEKGEIGLNPEIFGQDIRMDILHRIVHWQLAKRRAGTHAVKGRSDVQGSTRKIWAQKGTGRARHGSIRGAQFRGGGIIFGPVVRSHEYKLNKKVRRLGLKVALSLKHHEKSMMVLDNAILASPRTNALQKKFESMDIGSALIVDSIINDAMKLSVANLHKIDIMHVDGLNVLDILRHQKLLITRAAIEHLEGKLV